METVTTLPRGRELTRADLDAMPDDGHRYELIDGALVVTPAPTWRHQAALARLLILLDAACPPDLRVLMAPLDVALADDTVVQPDLLVARKSDFAERDLPAAPLLAVEILSPSTRLIDLNLKRARYQQAGSPSYWVVDPEARTVTVWELAAGGYAEAASAGERELLEVGNPFEVRIPVAELFA